MGTSAMQDDPMLRLQYYKETGQHDEAKQYEAYLRETKQWKGTDTRSLSARAAERRRINANEMDQANAETPDYASSALGGIAAIARGIPGAEALQALFASGPREGRKGMDVTPGLAYGDALSNIRGAQTDNPVGSGIASVAGSIPAIAAIPGGAALSGARYGILHGLLGADPATADTRLRSAAKEGTIGAIAGKAGEWLGTGVRAMRGGSLGEKALAMKDAIKAADDLAYGKAAGEAAATPTSPAIRAALEAPDIAPYAAAIRASRKHAGASDSKVLMEAYKLLSEHQGKLSGQMVNAGDFKAGTSLGAADASLAKQELLGAAEAPWTHTMPAVMGEAPAITTAQSPAPSMRDAVSGFWDRIGTAHARTEGTVAQRMARQSLERHGSEGIAAPLRGAPPGPRVVELSPETSTAMPAAIPSLRPAIEQHAAMMGERDAFRAAADATKRIGKGTAVAGKKLDQLSPEAFIKSVKKMTPREAKAALDGMLGRMNEQMVLSGNPFTAFGLGKSAIQANRMTPYLRLLDQQAGNTLPGLFGSSATAGAGLLSP